jgi:hypothetical protein
VTVTTAAVAARVPSYSATGALTGSWLGSTIGLRPTLWTATAGAVLGVAWLIPSPVPRIRSLDLPET